MKFKPVFERFAYANPNIQMAFAAVNVNDYRDIGRTFSITSVPQFSFFLNGKEHNKMVGASEDGFRTYLNDLDQ